MSRKSRRAKGRDKFARLDARDRRAKREARRERAERLLSNDDTDLVNAAQVSALAGRANDGLERLHEAAVAAERTFRSQVGP